jgi:hypothetical protein
MARPHPHINATYKVVAQKDMTFAVEVSVPEAAPTNVSSFATEVEAEQWIERHKVEVAKGFPKRKFYGARTH